MPEDKLQQLKSLIEVSRNSLSRADFTAAFKNVLEIVVKVQKDLIKKIDDLVGGALQRIDKKLSEVKNGIDGRDGKDGVSIQGPKGDKGDKGDIGRSIFGGRGEPGLPGKDGSPDTGDQIVEKINFDSKKLIVKTAIEGLDKIEKDIERIDKKPIGGLKGGNRQDNWHTGDLGTMHTLSVQATAPASPALNDLWVDTS